MMPSLDANQLKRHIDHDFEVCEQLLKLLKTEQDALKAKDADGIESLMGQKLPLLERLEASSKLRQAWAQQASIESNETGWASFISNLGEVNLKERWQQLKLKYQEVRQQNEINGKLLSRHQRVVTRMLEVMRGNTASPNLYNATGYSSSKAQSNKFGEA